MLESILISVKVVLPLMVFMGLGVLIRKRSMVSQSTIKEMNQVVFKVLLATMVFYNIYKADLQQDFDGYLLAYAAISVIIMLGILVAVIPRFIKDKTIAPVMIQGIYRSNFVLFGLQVTASICGSDNLGMTTILISVIIPMYNVIAVILFETFRRGKINIRSLLRGILTNPLIIASVMGLIALGLNVNFGSVVDDILKSISQMATPMSLILLGGTVTISGIKKYWKYTCIASIGRLVIVPAVFLSIAILIGIRGIGLVSLMVMYGSPTAVSSFPMAGQMGGNSELAGQIVATIFSVITVFIWTYLLSFYGLII